MLIQKIIEADAPQELERKVNQFLREKKNHKIFKISNDSYEIKILSASSNIFICYITYCRGPFLRFNNIDEPGTKKIQKGHKGKTQA